MNEGPQQTEDPETRAKQIIGDMLSELRGTRAPRISNDQELERDLGIDSLARAELALRIENVFGMRLPETLVAGAHTVRDLLHALAAASPRMAFDLALAQLGVPADDIALVGRHVILKTSSGKIRRAACRELYERGLFGKASRPVMLQFGRLALTACVAGARRLGRTIAAWLLAAYLWSLFLCLTAIGMLLLPVLTCRARQRWVRLLARGFIALSTIPVRVEGKERLMRAMPAVIVANHSSYCDFLLLTALQPAGAVFAAKREFATHPLVGPVLRSIGARFVERSGTQRAVEDAHDIARATAEMITLFPEGTFTRAEGLLPFHMGAFIAASESGRPVIPVALRGTRSVLRDGSWFPRRHAIDVFVGEPIVTEGTGWTEAARLRRETRRIILEHCGEPDAGETG